MCVCHSSPLKKMINTWKIPHEKPPGRRDALVAHEASGPNQCIHLRLEAAEADIHGILLRIPSGKHTKSYGK